MCYLFCADDLAYPKTLYSLVSQATVGGRTEPVQIYVAPSTVELEQCSEPSPYNKQIAIYELKAVMRFEDVRELEESVENLFESE